MLFSILIIALNLLIINYSIQLNR